MKICQLKRKLYTNINNIYVFYPTYLSPCSEKTAFAIWKVPLSSDKNSKILLV